MLAAVILAAGESKRMGRPKALVSFQGLTFAEHLLAATRLPRVGIMRIVVGAHADDIRAKLKIDPSAIVVNLDWPKGQLSSIHAAIRSLPANGTEGLILCPVDHPLVSLAVIAELIKQFDATGKLIALPTYRGKRGHPVIFRASLYDELLAAAPDVGARAVVWNHAQDIKEVAVEEEGVIMNLNDPETLRKVSAFRQHSK
jgi:molybdenum cofactor cytidylyltransferase